MFDLRSTSVLVTGGSKGIGRGIASVFAAAGANVAIAARSAVEIDAQPETLAVLLREAVENARSHLDGTNRDSTRVKVQVTCDEQIRIPISRAHIRMAFTNLIKNAIESHADRHKFRDGTVSVDACRDEQGVHVVISDTGGGLSVRDLARLQEFIPGQSSKGTGYGLPIAKKYIEAHRGSLALANREGIGLTVTVFLPDRF